MTMTLPLAALYFSQAARSSRSTRNWTRWSMVRTMFMPGWGGRVTFDSIPRWSTSVSTRI